MSEPAVALLGCDVIHADVAAPMVAVRARSTVRIETESSTAGRSV